MAVHSHSHSHATSAAGMTIRRLALALVITLVFVVAEAIAGLAANSLALLTDAAHNFTDVIALGLAWVAIMITGLAALDAVASVVIAVLIVFSAWRIIGDTVDILMENTPRGVNMDALVRDVLSVEGVKGVHDVHAWSITESMRAFSAHLLTDDISVSTGARIQGAVNRLLHERHGIAHATLQLECEGCEPDLLYCELDLHEHDLEGHHHEPDSIKE